MLQIITTKEELQETFNNAVSGAVAIALKQIKEEAALKDDKDDIINGLPDYYKFLDCSAPTGQKILKLRLFPIYQVGRKIMLRKSEILEGMKKVKTFKPVKKV